MLKIKEFKGLPVATPTACALGPRTQAGRRQNRVPSSNPGALTRLTEECENVALVPNRHVLECRRVWRRIFKEPGLEFAATVTVTTDVSSGVWL